MLPAISTLTSATVLILMLVTPTGMAQPSDVKIYPKSRESTRLAVADFVARTAVTPQTRTAAKVFNDVLWQDLKFSAFFEMPSKSFYPLKPLRSPQDVSFDHWQAPTLDVDFLAFGNVHVDAAGALIEGYLYDVKTRQQVLGKRYSVADVTLIRRVAHQLADQIVYQLSAGTSQGVATTQITYSSLKSGSKEIYTMDYDGSNVRTVTANQGINKFPDWSDDNSKLAFVTILPGSARWQFWIQNLQGGRDVIPTPTSYVSSPAFSPDGRRIAYSTRGRGHSNADIYVSDADGSGDINISNHRAIDTSPTWSPSSRQIAFISDRTGRPQLWLMEADGSDLRQLVSEGGHCDSPSWAPDGRHIIYSWQAPKRWKHDIYIVEVASGKIFQLTSGTGSNEHPDWSPDGRHIVFQSTRTGSKQLFIMNADGKSRRQITAYGINESPAWSGYLTRP